MATDLEALLAATPCAARTTVEVEGVKFRPRPLVVREILDLIQVHPCLRKVVFGHVPDRDIPFRMGDDAVRAALPAAARDFVRISLGDLPPPKALFPVFQAAMIATAPKDISAFFKPPKQHERRPSQLHGYYLDDPLVGTVKRCHRLALRGHPDPWGMTLQEVWFAAVVIHEEHTNEIARGAAAATVPKMKPEDQRRWWDEQQ